MIRKLNFTGRKRIKKYSVKIEILKESNRRKFNVDLDLAEYDLPGNAHIYIEAYHRSGYKRYDFGTIANLHHPRDRYLDEFLESIIPLFRVKVVDKSARIGKILAAADRIRPTKMDGKALDEKSLLWIVYEDIGEKAWSLDLDGDWPELRVNKRIADISQIVANDPHFLLLVYPEVFRQILRRILIEDKHFDPHLDDDWQSEWLRMAFALPGLDRIVEDDSLTDKEIWIDQAVDAFCKKNRLLERFNRGSSGEADR